MKKTLKYILIVFGLLIAFGFISSTNVHANTIHNIDMDVSLDSNGNAHVTEVWSTNVNTGSECYKTYSNLGNCTISNFSVTDDTKKSYSLLSNWDTSKDLNAKAYKCGIKKVPMS